MDKNDTIRPNLQEKKKATHFQRETRLRLTILRKKLEKNREEKLEIVKLEKQKKALTLKRLTFL